MWLTLTRRNRKFSSIFIFSFSFVNIKKKRSRINNIASKAWFKRDSNLLLFLPFYPRPTSTLSRVRISFYGTKTFPLSTAQKKNLKKSFGNSGEFLSFFFFSEWKWSENEWWIFHDTLFVVKKRNYVDCNSLNLF